MTRNKTHAFSRTIFAALLSSAILAASAEAQEIISGGASSGVISSPLGANPVAQSLSVNPATGSAFPISPPNGGLPVNDNGVFNSTAPTLQSGGTGPLQLDVNGRLLTALPSGAAKDSTLSSILSNQNVTAAGTTAANGQGVQGVTGGVPLPVTSNTLATASNQNVTAGGTASPNGVGIQGVQNAVPIAAQAFFADGAGNTGSAVSNAQNYARVDAKAQLKISETGSSDPAVAIVPAITQSGTSLVGKNAPGNLYGAYALNLTGTSGYLVTVNATAVPAAGGAITPQDVVPIAANGTAVLNFNAGPADNFSTGVVVLLTTSLTTYTAGPSGFIQARTR